MKKNIFILIGFIFLITGCSSEYNLEFSNDIIKEHTIVTIKDSEIPSKSSTGELDDRITPFIENDQYPFYGKYDKVYKKKVTKKGDTTTVVLDYTFSHDDFKNSTVYKGCFKSSDLTETNDGYSLHMHGSFYCLYGDELTINIKTNNIVLEHNADKVSGNVYTWIINKDNMTDTNIKMEISKKNRYTKYIGYTIVIILVIGLCVGGYFVYKRFKDRDSINEI